MSKDSRGIVGGDSRLRKDGAGDPMQRGDAALAGDAERINSADGTVMTREERRRLIRSEWQQSVLPTPPEIPGFHTCWLSTTNSSDTIHRRLKVGYILVRKDEFSGFDIERGVQSANSQYADYVCCNEMVLGKIPMETYQDAMAAFHHYQPQEEEHAIRARVQSQSEEINREAGVAAVRPIGGGFDSLGQTQSNEPPVFSG